MTKGCSSAASGLNPAKCQMTGTTLTLSKSGNVYHEKNNTGEHDYTCDGNDHQLLDLIWL